MNVRLKSKQLYSSKTQINETLRYSKTLPNKLPIYEDPFE